MEIVLLLLGAAAGAAGGFVAKANMAKKTIGEAEGKAKKKLEEAENKNKQLVLEAKEEAVKIMDEAKKAEEKRRAELSDMEKRLHERESHLDTKIEELDQRSQKLRDQEDELTKFKDELKKIRDDQQAKLEKIAKLSKAEAAEKLLQMTERDIKEDLLKVVAKEQQAAVEEAEDRAKVILTTAMERMAGDVTAEKTVSTVALPNDEMKGRVIGKEGRNIQTIERLTGVDVMVDDTPGVVVLSSFDPIRREVARRTLEELMKDGRIHPGRIEEIVAKIQQDLDKETLQEAEAAERDLGLTGVPKEMLRMVGDLKYRTSFSQNVLKHSVEMAELAGSIAAEVGADVRVAKTAAFIHDAGKSVSHKQEGKHHHITGAMARKYGMDEAIAHAAEAHHDDIEAKTPEALIVRAVDALSGGRPGARGDNVENYVKRMTDLENVANGFPGIEKSYAISAGREMRIFVRPQEIDDLSAIKLARDIATKIESTLQYPGTIRVNVIRETRAIEYAK